MQFTTGKVSSVFYFHEKLKYYHNTENVFLTATMLSRSSFTILQTFKSHTRRKNNRRQFCFRARKEEKEARREKGRIGIYDASINNVNASAKKILLWPKAKDLVE